ncbi:uncharacterized protein TRIVIDRAFT_736, partial [Trichoderma virens Gv29-8]
YSALSYVWGRPEKQHIISIGSHSLSITANLHAALLRLRDRFLERIIWVDAICIDQENLEERGSQVQLMARIYHMASCVIVWLGEFESNSDRAIEGINAAADGQHIENDQIVHQAVVLLLQREWFKRIWVLQEVAAARSVLLICGPTEIDGYIFCLGLKALNIAYTDYPDLQSLIHPTIYLIRRAIFRSKHTTPSEAGRFSLNIRPLSELIDMYHTRQASDRRDKVYALLGMCSDNHGSALSPDYNIPWKQLFIRLIQFILGDCVSYGDEDSYTLTAVRELAMVYKKMDRLKEGEKLEEMANLIDRSGEHCQITEEGMMRLARLFDKDVMELLLYKRGDEAIVTGKVIKAALQNLDHSEAILTLLLGNYEHQIAITEEAIEFAAQYSDRLTMELFLMRRRDQIPITERILQAAVTNPQNYDILPLLLQYKGRQAPITERTIEAALRRGYQCPHIRMLLNCQWNQITIPTVYVEAIVWHNGELLNPLLDLHGDKITITEELTKAAAASTKATMSLLLTRRGDQVIITEDIIKVAAGNQNDGLEVIKLLLDRRRDQVTITEDIIKVAAGNEKYGVKMMQLILNQWGDQVIITEDIIKVAAGNERRGVEIMKLLLDQRGSQITTTEDVIKVAAGNKGRGLEIMQLLLNQRGDQIAITEDIIKAAAGNEGRGMEMMQLLLDQRRDQIMVTEDIIKAAAGNQRRGVEMMQLLFDQRGDQVTITEDIIEVAVGNRHGVEITKLLLNQRRDEIAITQCVIKAAARNEGHGMEIIKLLLDSRGGQVIITGEFIENISGNWRGYGIMDLLLRERGNQITITEEALKVAAGKDSSTEIMELLITRQGDRVIITEEV